MSIAPQARQYRTLRWCALLAALLAAPLVHGADNALVVNPSPLRAGPERTAEAKQLLRQGERVAVLSRQAGWVEVKTGGNITGWVHMTGLKLGSPSVAQRTGGFFRWLGRGAGSRTASNSNVTIGVRGISEEDLARAQPNPAALAQMEAVPSGPEVGKQFGQSKSLQAQSVAYLPTQPGAPS